MIPNRHRGLVRIHGVALILAVALFFWVYAEIIMRYVPVVRLSREVNLLPYFLCVLIGLLAGGGRIRAVEARLTRLSVTDAAGLTTTHVALMALAIFSMMFATQDTSISRLFLGTFLVGSWLGLYWLHRTLPRRLARLLFGSAGRIPTLFIGRAGDLARLQDWLDERTPLGVEPVAFVALGDAKPESGDLKPEVSELSSGFRSQVSGFSASVSPSENRGDSPKRRPEDEPRDASRHQQGTPGGQQAATGRSQVSGFSYSPQVSGFSFQVSALSALPEVLAENAISQVILLELPDKPAVAREILQQCQTHGCRLLIHHQVDDILGHPVVSVDEGGRHFFALHEEPLEDPLNRALKRLFDVAVSLPVVVFILPPLILWVWLAQRRQAPGPLFHARPRSGEHRVSFSMLKFRSMQVAPADAKAESLQAQAGDPRIYPFGHFLRRHSLDEFPQFWNVLLGQMSIVGPRPVMPLLDTEFERQVKSYRSKHWVKPGITGLAQSEGFRGEITTPAQLQERIRLDLHYIAHWSIWLDAAITLKTLRQVFVPPSSAY